MAALTFIVSAGDTARALGSGDLEVLGTPRLLAWMEAATLSVLAHELLPGQTSVGTRVEVAHLLAVGPGARVVVAADQVHADGRLRRFAVSAQDADGRLLGTATVTRVIVERTRFMARVAGS
jgi:fluoroacetyl-CoA thioesterase